MKATGRIIGSDSGKVGTDTRRIQPRRCDNGKPAELNPGGVIRSRKAVKPAASTQDRPRTHHRNQRRSTEDQPQQSKGIRGRSISQPQGPEGLAPLHLRHICDREMSQGNRLRQPASFKVGDLVLVHHSRLPSWPRNCLQDPYFGPYRIIRINGSRIHVRCPPRLGDELLCAPKQLRHYHSPDDLSWDEWRLSDSEVGRIDLENAASPEEADELKEMTAKEMAVHGYYVVAGIARHEYKQGWKFLTLWDGYGLSEASWEPMSAFIQPDDR